MKFHTFTGDISLIITTIILKNTKRKNLDMFRCSHCGRGIIHNSGQIIASFPGMIPHDDTPVVSRCLQSNCRQFYTFQTENVPLPEYAQISLLLLPEKKAETFYCFICGNEVVTFTDTLIHDLSTDTNHKPPYKTSCPHNTCRKKYEFTEILTVDAQK